MFPCIGIARSQLLTGARSSIASSPASQRPCPAREPRAIFRIDDAPRKEQVFRRQKVIGIVEKKRPLLREIDFEPLIDSNLRIVRFHLAEIGIERDIERERVMQNHFGVEAGAMFVLLNVAGGRKSVSFKKCELPNTA